MVNILSILVLLALAGLFAWLATRAWRSRRGWVRWPGLVLSGLLGLVFLAVTVVALLGFYRLSMAPHQYSVADTKVALTQENVARGERFAHLCADCHSSTGGLPLDGSKDNFVAGGPPVGVLYAPNLTPGGPLKDWTDGEIMRAIREGVDKNGHPLVIMPSQGLHDLSDADVAALVAYIRSQPAVNRDLPKRDMNVLAALFFGAGLFPTSAQVPITGPVAAPNPGTAEYGKYIVSAYGCKDCHGPDLGGLSSSPGGGPGAPNLTAIVPNWKEASFMDVFRKGTDPTGRTISDDMPWKSYGKAFTDDELRDIYNYLHSLPKVEPQK
jgi:mono/diheme cytochrome c family protein